MRLIPAVKFQASFVRLRRPWKPVRWSPDLIIVYFVGSGFSAQVRIESLGSPASWNSPVAPRRFVTGLDKSKTKVPSAALVVL